MSEWTSVVAVFWVLWALDGVRFGPRRVFTVVGDWRARRGRIVYSRLSLPGVLPGSWRVAMADVPLSVSPAGLSNVPIGSTGRPAETPFRAQACRWEDVREIGVAHGWIFVNGVKFCVDTGHVSAAELLALARLEPGSREKRLRAILPRWFRPTQLRRRACVLTARTQACAWLNALALLLFAALSIYVAGDLAARLAPRTSDAIARALPWLVLGAFASHVAAVVIAWRSLRRLRAAVPQKRSAVLFSALLLPPQALRLRAVLGDGFFPPQHPLTAVVAFGRRRAREAASFDTLADLRWPLARQDEPPLAREIAAWFRAALEPHLAWLLARQQLVAETLLAPPAPDTPASCSYCPRCRDQFVAGRAVCPHGVPLQPLGRGPKGLRNS